ncbi:hypothetical protein GCM10010982_08350 [Bowmanella pacifica]|uniref:Uncharacterized protein n=1 Tax=Bowmanella pacifica TaxID=502051 RepID=A0A918DI93_9ALTE|nr:hypothetical protein GCM10010982_08350 [Bowmanella pacifica]
MNSINCCIKGSPITKVRKKMTAKYIENDRRKQSLPLHNHLDSALQKYKRTLAYNLINYINWQ